MRRCSLQTTYDTVHPSECHHYRYLSSPCAELCTPALVIKVKRSADHIASHFGDFFSRSTALHKATLSATEWWGAGVAICLERGADLHTAQLMPLPLAVDFFSKIQIGLPFWYRLTRAVPLKGPLLCVCMYVCKATLLLANRDSNRTKPELNTSSLIYHTEPTTKKCKKNFWPQ